MTKTPQDGQLTEWQKRNLEFQARKKERQAAKEKEEAKRLEERWQQFRPQGASAPFTPRDLDQPQPSTLPFPDPIKPEKEPSEAAEPQPTQSLPTPKKRTFSSSHRQGLNLITWASLVLLFSLFMISPYSKEKIFVVTGTSKTTTAEVLAATGIKDSDYIISLIGRLKEHEKALIAKNPWVKSASISYSFPQTFKILVKEHPIVAYNLTNKGYRPVLSTGQQIDQFGDGQLPEGFLPLFFDKASDRKDFIQQYIQLDQDLRQAIQEVNFADNAATADLLILTMAEGHTVRVPLSELAKKLPYYQSIKKDLLYPTIIDMEVGIYTTTPELEALASETRASHKQKQREQEALEKQEATSSSSSGRSRTETETETSSSSSTTSSD